MINRILYLMDRDGINAKSLTNELCISHSSISDWKKGKGKPSADTIIKLANHFNVSTDWILTGVEVIPKLQPNYDQIKPIFIEQYKTLPYTEKMQIIGELATIAETSKNDIKENKGKSSNLKIG